MKQNEKAIHVFLDFQTAYDRVDRRILWMNLKTKFKIQDEMIQMLQVLFDDNESILEINGLHSTPIENKRGLLQGSSLSPILFNLFINDMLDKLQQEENKVKTDNIETNHLCFADDATVHSNNPKTLQRLLNVCEEWSLQVGMKFEPTKCVILGADPEDKYYIYGKEVPKVDSTKYLGITFNKKGIDWENMIQEKENKIHMMTIALGKIGFSLNGWSLKHSITVYKTFIRSALEYGLPLMDPENKKILDELQKIQDFSIRIMLSATSTTSVHAMHKITQIPLIKTRTKQLKA